MTGRPATTNLVCVLTVRVPLVHRKRGGRKQVVTPDGATGIPPRQRIDNTMVKAIARADRWKRMLELGDFASIAELAEHEKVAPSYMTRVMRMTLLAPQIVEAIVEGRQGPKMTLAGLLQPVALEWEQQHQVFHPG